MNLNAFYQKSIIHIKGVIFALIFAAFLLTGGTLSYASGWGTLSGINAEAAIVMDVDTGAVLYGKNTHDTYYPASITKLMTALVVLENCELDETVTFSQTAVSDLEYGAVTAYMSAGDEMSVEDCLYALLFYSANDVANALAEHVAGSLEEFAAIMNEKAEALGCTDTNFKNPSGLTDPEHITSAYDMALIAAELFDNETFLEIESVNSYRLPANENVPTGLLVTIEHRMLREGSGYYDSRVVGGKTGYITASGNTLVTMAEDEGRRLAAVVLRDTNPEHYIDTKTLLDFGFDNFYNADATSVLSLFDIESHLIEDAVLTEGGNNIETDKAFLMTLPNGAAESDVEVSYDLDLGDYAPEGAVAKLTLTYDGHTSGSYYILNEKESTISLEMPLAPDEIVSAGIPIVTVAGVGIAVVLLIAVGIAYRAKKVREERLRKQQAKKRQRRRLESLGVSEEEFTEHLRRYRERNDKRRDEQVSES